MCGADLSFTAAFKGVSGFKYTDNGSEEGTLLKEKKKHGEKRVVPSVKKDIRDFDQSCYIGKGMHNVADLHIHMCNSLQCH